MNATIGLIVNPVAGLGGRLAQKGSDALDIRDLATRAGIETLAPERARQTVQLMLAGAHAAGTSVRILAGAGEMGAAVLGAGIPHQVIASSAIHPGASTSADTRSIARKMVDAGADLLLFAGGDGTARDVLDAVGTAVPVLGIPAGVKIYSGVFGLTPAETGVLAASWIAHANRSSEEREVVDIDEDELRRGLATPSLYGTLRVPADSRRLQPRKSGSPASDANAARSLGLAFAATMMPNRYYVLGPGSTTMAIGSALDVKLTRLGVDVVCNGQLVAEDLDADSLNSLVPAEGATIVVTPLGLQGFVIGRGNQQIDHRVLARSELKIVATPSKMISLGGRPLWVDSGHPELDAMLCGYTRVFTGANAEVIYPISNTADGHVRAYQHKEQFMRLKDKSAIVTGGGSGIGRATALAMAAEGANVAIFDINGEAAQKVAAEAAAFGVKTLGLAVNVASADDVQRGVAEAAAEFGTVNVLFNNAGIIRRANVLETTLEEWDQVMGVNVRGPFLMSKYVVPLMIAAGGGSIVNTGSGWGLKGGGDALSYCTSKAAVVNMTRALAIDHGPDNIRVNSVNPGDTNTPMLREEARQLSQAEAAFLEESNDRPLKRMGTPEEIAEAVIWLASDASSYVTGSALVVDGGGIA